MQNPRNPVIEVLNIYSLRTKRGRVTLERACGHHVTETVYADGKDAYVEELRRRAVSNCPACQRVAERDLAALLAANPEVAAKLAALDAERTSVKA